MPDDLNRLTDLQTEAGQPGQSRCVHLEETTPMEICRSQLQVDLVPIVDADSPFKSTIARLTSLVLIAIA